MSRKEIIDEKFPLELDGKRVVDLRTGHELFERHANRIAAPLFKVLEEVSKLVTNFSSD